MGGTTLRGKQIIAQLLRSTENCDRKEKKKRIKLRKVLYRPRVPILVGN